MFEPPKFQNQDQVLEYEAEIIQVPPEPENLEVIEEDAGVDAEGGAS